MSLLIILTAFPFPSPGLCFTHRLSTICLSLSLFYGLVCNLQKFPGLGLNLSHSSGNNGSLTHWATGELPKTTLLICSPGALWVEWVAVSYSCRMSTSFWVRSDVALYCVKRDLLLPCKMHMPTLNAAESNEWVNPHRGSGIYRIFCKWWWWWFLLMNMDISMLLWMYQPWPLYIEGHLEFPQETYKYHS